MALIRVLKVPKTAIDPSRPINALLRAQVVHLREAERMLPLRYQSDIYVNAIRTENEAAEYIGAVTEAIHQAHTEAAARRARKVPKPKRKTHGKAGAARKTKRHK